MGDSTTWHFIGLVLIIFLASIQGRAGRMGTLGMVLCSFPATLLHELSHWTVCLVSGGGPTGFTLLPELVSSDMEDGSERKRWRLGSVGISKPGILSTVPTALAPLLYIPAALLVFLYWDDFFTKSLVSTLLMYVTICFLVTAAIPSSQDIRTAFSNLSSVVLYMGIIGPSIFLWYVF
ncbi:MAG: hypothetical protein WCG31_07770 [Deltaproteobacteria bacterium]